MTKAGTRPHCACALTAATDAIEAYTGALALRLDEVVLSNRSAASLSAGLAFEAADDALACIKVDRDDEGHRHPPISDLKISILLFQINPHFSKGWLRLSNSLAVLSQCANALNALDECLKRLEGERGDTGDKVCTMRDRMNCISTALDAME